MAKSWLYEILTDISRVFLKKRRRRDLSTGRLKPRGFWFRFPPRSALHLRCDSHSPPAQCRVPEHAPVYVANLRLWKLALLERVDYRRSILLRATDLPWRSSCISGKTSLENYPRWGGLEQIGSTLYRCPRRVDHVKDRKFYPSYGGTINLEQLFSCWSTCRNSQILTSDVKPNLSIGSETAKSTSDKTIN